MIHWAWLFPVLLIGCGVGFSMAAMLVANRCDECIGEVVAKVEERYQREKAGEHV